MMHVDGLQATDLPQSHQHVQQDDRVATTGEANRQPLFRCKAGGEKSADPLRQVN